MILIKRLHTFMLKTFLPLFAMTFFIVLFIVLMQFLWKYIDDLVGKGLGFGVIAELFFYAAVSMVPMALPLAILLASLMTFGNLGEKFELTAMKASGISLIKVMAPLIVTVGIVAVGAFFFQNDILPKAQVKMWTLLFSVRQKSPELEIPEGVFYDQIPGYNLYVSDKNRDTGMMFDVMIYNTASSGGKSTILTADSAQMALTPDMGYLYLHLFQGEQFENLRDQNVGSSENVPFRRETFLDKQILIPFDANFNRLDEEGMRKQYIGKNISQLRHTMDSVSLRIDSIGRDFGLALQQSEVPMLNRQRFANSEQRTSKIRMAHPEADNPVTENVASDETYFRGKSSGEEYDSEKAVERSDVPAIDIKKLLASESSSQRKEVYRNAVEIASRRQQMLTFRAQVMADEKKTLRRHDIELVKKFTLSVACLIFFFIGAPLGAIIRKGGIGTPLVISVLLFLVYYIIDNTGYKMARDGHIAVWVGMWLSTFVLAPLGVFVTWKAMNDSAVFDPERVKEFLRKIVGRKQKRIVPYKEVVINDFSWNKAAGMLQGIKMESEDLLFSGLLSVSYLDYWLHPDNLRRQVSLLSSRLDAMVDYLSDSGDSRVIRYLADFPVPYVPWIINPNCGKLVSWIMAMIIPIGLPVWLGGWQGRRDLRKDLQKIIATSAKIIEKIPD